MARMDLPSIKELINETLAGSTLSDKFEAVTVDEEPDFSGSEFLRVFLVAKDKARLTDDQLDSIVSGIERALGDKDERFASVFFPGLE